MIFAFCWSLSQSVVSIFLLTRRISSKSTTGAILNSGQKKLFRYFIDIGIIVISIFITVFGLSEGLETPQVKEVEIKIIGLHPDLERFCIAQISDLHIFPDIQRNLVQQIVDRVNDLSPDVIALTGDIAEGDYSQIQRDVDTLAKLRAKCGVFFVTGNHEYIAGAGSWIKVMKNLGFTVLQNEHRLITHGHGVLLLGGVNDHSSHDSSPAKAMGSNTKADVKILLAHQPASIYEAARVGFDLQLSGHTHGGLLSPVRWVASLGAPFQSGLYKYENTQIYVSNGTGNWGIPFRIGAPLEISLLKLTGG
jgi:predicted MPP superfamily phosphohydrolase